MSLKQIILGFDMETDRGSWTSGCRGLVDGTPAILRVLKSHEVKATFLFTGREAQNHAGVVESVLSHGHEIGCHTMYHETMGEEVFDMPGGNVTLDSELPGRLTLATEVLERIAGVRPVSFRAPRLAGSTQMIAVLEDLGYVADSSFPSYFHGRDFLPYRPSREDWSKEGDMRILELPVFYDVDATTDGGPLKRGRDQWPMLRLKGAAWFSNLCLRMLNKVTYPDGGSVLCVYLHPWEFVEMPATVATGEATIRFRPFLHRNCGEYAIRALDEFIRQMRGNGVTFVTMRDYASSFVTTS